MDPDALVIDAFAQLGVDARQIDGHLTIDPDGVAVPIDTLRRSTVSDTAAQHLLAEQTRPEAQLLVVADRVTDAARKALLARRAGYLDLRGRLAIRSDRLLVEADVTPVQPRAERSTAVSGQAGLEVATALLMRPEQSALVRELGRRVRRAPSTVSEILAALRRDGHINNANNVVGTGLFRQVADRWPTERTYLAGLPTAGGAPDDPGWALTGLAAAAEYGAPVTVEPGQVPDFFVPDTTTADRAADLLGIATSADQVRATMRVAPVFAAVAPRFESMSLSADWLLTHRLFVALDWPPVRRPNARSSTPGPPRSDRLVSGDLRDL